VLPQTLERRRVGSVAAVHRADPSSSPQHSRDSNMIPVGGTAAQQSSSRQVTIFITSFTLDAYHTVHRGEFFFLTFDRETRVSKTVTKKVDQ